MLKSKTLLLWTVTVLVPGLYSLLVATQCKATESEGSSVMANLNESAMHSDTLRPRMMKGLVSDLAKRHRPIYIEKKGNHESATVHIICGSGDAQFDLDCLQAFCGIDTSSNDAYSTGFDIAPDQDDFAKERAEFRRANEISAKANVLLYYKIPLDVACRFESVFTKSELCKASNIGMLENNSSVTLTPEVQKKMIDLYTVAWPNFFRTHANPTHAEFVEYARAVCP